MKYEKTHSLDHEHILSGILRCPLCGSGMYGNVNRKKKKDGTLYKDYFYYACKHRRLVDGHKCGYRKQWSEEKINNAVEEVIRKLVKNPKFEEAILNKIGSRIDTEEIEKEIEGVENNIEEVKNRLLNIRQQKISEENVYQFLLYFDKLYDKFTDLEKKEFLNSFVEQVDIYEQEQPDGRFLKHIKFRFPVYFGDRETQELCWDNESTVESIVLLSHKSPDSHIDVKVEFGEGEEKVPLDKIAERAKQYQPAPRVTYKMIQEYIEEKYGFKVHTAYIAEVKRNLGLPMYDAPNMVEELKQPRRHPTAEKVEAIKDALKHFGVI